MASLLFVDVFVVVDNDNGFVAVLAGLLLARGLYHCVQGHLQLQSMVGGQDVASEYDTQVVATLHVCNHL